MIIIASIYVVLAAVSAAYVLTWFNRLSHITPCYYPNFIKEISKIKLRTLGSGRAEISQ
jgi:hypothetical protein